MTSDSTHTDDRQSDDTTASAPLVVGVDGSPTALRALDWAAREAAVRGVGLRLVYAYPNDTYALTILDVRPEDHANVVFSEAREQLSATGAGDVEITTTLRQGPAPRVLLRAARRSPMLVVGRQGRGPVGDFIMGSTSLACTTHAHRPVTVVPRQWEAPAQPSGTVLLGVDGSRRGDTAVQHAFELAADRGARITVVYAIELPYGYPLDQPMRTDAPHFEAKAARVFAASLDHWREKYPGVDVATITEYDYPEVALAKHAVDADLAVIGGRGHGLITGMLLGSVAHAVLRRLPIPTTVVHENRG